jgi:hypothetical protein
MAPQALEREKARRSDSDGNPVTARHLLVVIDQHTRVVLGQVDVDGKTNEISAFTLLLAP